MVSDETLNQAAKAGENTSPEVTHAAVKDKLAKRGKASIDQRVDTLEELVVEYVPINSVRPNDYNPNRQSEADFELLMRSIDEDGFTQPIIVHKESRQIVDGEHRWRAASKHGMTEIPVVFVSMSEEQMKISTLRHNRARGSEDMDLSVQVLRDLQKLGAIEWAQESLMIDDKELNQLLSEELISEGLAAEAFSEAWIPEGVGREVQDVEEGTASPIIREMADKNGGVNASAMTESAIAAVKERRTLVLDATTDKERQAALRSITNYRLTLIYEGDEADLVRTSLGDRPADTLLALCKAEYEP